MDDPWDGGIKLHETLAQCSNQHNLLLKTHRNQLKIFVLKLKLKLAFDHTVNCL